MANIDNPAETLKADGIVKNDATVGSQAIDTGRETYAISVEEPSTEAAPSEQTLDAPAPAPNLEALLTPDKDKHLDTVVEALQKGDKTKLFKLMPDEKEKVEAFNKNGKNSKERRHAIAKLLKDMRRKGTLAPHLKAAGVSKEATAHALAVAQAADAPKPSGAKVDPKTGRVITAKELKDIQTKSIVYVQAGTKVEKDMLIQGEGNDEFTADMKTKIPRLKNHTMLKTASAFAALVVGPNTDVTKFKAITNAAPNPNLILAFTKSI